MRVDQTVLGRTASFSKREMRRVPAELLIKIKSLVHDESLERNAKSVSLFLRFLSRLPEEQGEERSRRRERFGSRWRVEGRVAIIRATIVRLSLNDANKFDYSCFEIFLLRKCRHHRRHHRRRCSSAGGGGGQAARRVETRGPGDRSRRFEPTRAPSRPARIYFTAKQKISERLGLRRLALLTPRARAWNVSDSC